MTTAMPVIIMGITTIITATHRKQARFPGGEWAGRRCW
jgi:hypothetical protein